MHTPVGGEPVSTGVVAAPLPASPGAERRARRQATRTSLRASIKDGIAWSVMHGAGERYVAPFVILSGSGLLRLAAITALPVLGGALIQRVAAAVTDSYGRRKRIFIAAAILQVLLWIPFSVAIFLPHHAGYWLMLAAYVLFVGAHNFSLPAWFSTMGDLVPVSRRGRYFGRRNFLAGVVMIVAFLGAGAWLTWCENHAWFSVFGVSGRNLGFLSLFVMAGLARAVSTCYLRQMVEPAYHAPPEDRFSLRQFLRRLPHGSYGRFVLYRAGLHAGRVMVVTYLSWHILDQLGLSPLVFAWVMTASLLATYGAQPLWGRLADRLGNKRVLAIGGIASIATPALLLVSNSPWLFAMALLFDGVVLAALSIAGSNYLLDVVTPSKRARCLAYANIINAAAATMGAFGGALIILVASRLAALPATLGGVRVYPFALVLLAALVLLVLPNVLLLPKFHEGRVGLSRATRGRPAMRRHGLPEGTGHARI